MGNCVAIVIFARMKNNGIYSQWIAAKQGTWFTTRSRYPEMPCYAADEEMPFCSNFASYLPDSAKVSAIREYLLDQVRILRFNNPDHKKFMVKIAITQRIAFWRGNKTLLNDPYYTGKLLDEAIDWCYEDPKYANEIHFDYKRYWYSDQIMLMSGEGGKKSERYQAKHDARSAVRLGEYLEDLDNAIQEYGFENFGVRPTIKELREITGYSYPTIRKYSRGHFVTRKENIEARVRLAREHFLKYTQQQVADLLKETKRTVRQYWSVID